MKKLEIKHLEEGHIIFYASVFGVVDTHNDVTHKGTFVETKKNFEEGNHSIDLRIEHKQTFKTIGSVVEMEIDEHGLKCKAVFHDTPIGRKAHKIAKEVFETKAESILFSIGFVTLDSSEEIIEGKKVRSLDNVELGEVSVVEKPSNIEAKVLEVKQMSEEEAIAEEVRLKEALELNQKKLNKLYERNSKKADELYEENEKLYSEIQEAKQKRLIIQVLNS